MSQESTRIAACQLEPAIGAVDENLRRAEALVAEAVGRGAEIVVLPEFFSTGMAYLDAVAEGVRPLDGEPAQLLARLAREHGILLGGSFLARHADGHVRNTFVLAGPDGIRGTHDKDLPTMWENAAYVGGADDGVLELGDGRRVGVALCWEMIRSHTVRRLQGRVDLVLSGTAWWSIPERPASRGLERMAATNRQIARAAPPYFARYVGVPLACASLAGRVECPSPMAPFPYVGTFEGPTCVCDARGKVLDELPREGSGVALADVVPGAQPPAEPAPSSYWLVDRGPLPTLAWNLQRWHGRHVYRRRQRAAAAA